VRTEYIEQAWDQANERLEERFEGRKG
jgi:hypothetical protein